MLLCFAEKKERARKGENEESIYVVLNFLSFLTVLSIISCHTTGFKNLTLLKILNIQNS